MLSSRKLSPAITPDCVWWLGQRCPLGHWHRALMFTSSRNSWRFRTVNNLQGCLRWQRRRWKYITNISYILKGEFLYDLPWRESRRRGICSRDCHHPQALAWWDKSPNSLDTDSALSALLHSARQPLSKSRCSHGSVWKKREIFYLENYLRYFNIRNKYR